MRNKPRCRPQLEILEPITLLSGLSLGLQPAATTVRTDGAPPNATTPTFVSLNGKLTGSYHLNPGIPDVGAKYVFSGHGLVKSVGNADATGELHRLGFIASGHVKGLLVLSTPQGSLTLKLEGPKQKGFAPLPDRFSFKITDGSGKYLRDRGHGTLILVLDSAQSGADHGTFTMILVS